MDFAGSPSDDAGLTRRAALRAGAVTAAGGLAGCMQPLLEEETEEAGGNESTPGSPDGSADEFENALELEPAWDVDIFGSRVLTIDGTFFTQVGDRQLTELDPDGDVRWEADAMDVEDHSYSLPSPSGSQDAFAVRDDAVYCGVLAHEDGTGYVYAYGYDDGSTRWRHEPDEQVSTSRLAATDGGVVYAGGDGSGDWTVLRALDTDGEPRWSRTLEDDTDGPSAVLGLEYVDGNVYVTDAFSMRVYDASDGSTVDVIEFDPTVQRELAVEGSRMYLFPHNGDRLTAFDLAAHERDWEQDLERTAATAPTLVGETIYVGVEGGYVHAYDATDGSLRWESSRLDGSVEWHPIVDEYVWVTDDVGTVYALERESGELQYRETYESNRASGVVTVGAADGVVLIGDTGQAYSVDPV